MDTNNPQSGIVLSREDVERWFGILEYLLIKATFLALAAIGAYHLITQHGGH
jgi:hypothetical protein